MLRTGPGARPRTAASSPQVVEDTIVDVVEELLATAATDVAAIGIGAAGFVDADRATVLFAPHLSWRRRAAAVGAAEAAAPLPVVVDNDANAAVWAGVAVRRRRAARTHVMLRHPRHRHRRRRSSSDGQVQRGRFGVAGEFGHMQVVPGGHRCECGNRGCWEQYASGNALVREARELDGCADSPVAQRPARARRTASAAESDRSAGHRGGHATATRPRRELLDEIGHWLGVGIANLAAAFDPGTFVIGGGVSEAGDLLLDPARDTFRAAR